MSLFAAGACVAIVCILDCSIGRSVLAVVLLTYTTLTELLIIEYQRRGRFFALSAAQAVFAAIRFSFVFVATLVFDNLDALFLFVAIGLLTVSCLLLVRSLRHDVMIGDRR